MYSFSKSCPRFSNPSTGTKSLVLSNGFFDSNVNLLSFLLVRNRFDSSTTSLSRSVSCIRYGFGFSLSYVIYNTWYFTRYTDIESHIPRFHRTLYQRLRPSSIPHTTIPLFCEFRLLTIFY